MHNSTSQGFSNWREQDHPTLRTFLWYCCNQRLYSSVFVSAHGLGVFMTLSDLWCDSHFMSHLAQLQAASWQECKPPWWAEVRGGGGGFQRAGKISGKTFWNFDLNMERDSESVAEGRKTERPSEMPNTGRHLDVWLLFWQKRLPQFDPSVWAIQPLDWRPGGVWECATSGQPLGLTVCVHHFFHFEKSLLSFGQTLELKNGGRGHSGNMELFLLDVPRGQSFRALIMGRSPLTWIRLQMKLLPGQFLQTHGGKDAPKWTLNLLEGLLI